MKALICVFAQDDLGLCCPHMPEDTFVSGGATHNIHFCGEIRKKHLPDTPSYLVLYMYKETDNLLSTWMQSYCPWVIMAGLQFLVGSQSPVYVQPGNITCTSLRCDHSPVEPLFHWINHQAFNETCLFIQHYR